MPSPLANPYNIGQLGDLVSNALISWGKGSELAMNEANSVRQLFMEERAQQRTETFSDFSNSGLSSKTGDGEDFALKIKTQGDSISTTQIKRTARIKITSDLLEYNKYPEINSQMKDTGGFLWRGYALDLSHKFTYAFDTTYVDRDGETVTVTGGDGAALSANTHTMNDGSTYDNLLTARLSESSLEDADDLGNAIVDHNGQLVTVRFDTILTSNHAATKHMAMRLVGQPNQPDTDFRNMAVYNGTRHIVLPLLDTTAVMARDTTKSRFWFYVASSRKDDLKARVRRWPDVEAPTKDPDNNNLQFKAEMHYDIVHLNAWGVIGSNAV